MTRSEIAEAVYAAFHQMLFVYSDTLAATDIKEIRILERNVFVETRNGLLFELKAGDERQAPLEVLNFGECEKTELGFLQELVDRASCVLDIGANVGWHALHLARFAGSVHAFEPIRSTYRRLVRHVELNRATNVFPHNLGFLDRPQSGSMVFDPRKSTSASVVDTSGLDREASELCTFLTIDSWVSAHGVKPHLIKLDIEGAEFLALKGAENTLDQFVPAIFCEMLRKHSKVYGYSPNDIVRFMSNHGYICSAIGRDEKSLKEVSELTSATSETNFIFLHETHHKSSLDRLLG